MSQEERSMSPGDILKGIGEMFVGDGVTDLPGTTYGVPGTMPAAPGTMPAAPGTAPEGYWPWHNAPYAPPFNVMPGTTYPQLYQIPWSYFPSFPYRPELTEGGNGDEDLREVGSPLGGPYHYYPYHHHYPYYYYRANESGETEQTDINETTLTNPEDTRQPFFGFPPFGPPFGFGFGFPFFPRPFFPPFFPRPFFPFFPGPFFPRPFF